MITLLKQNSLGMQKFSKNELQHNVHVVAKNIPFCMIVGSNDINLGDKRTKLSIKLFYDSSDEDYKPVDYVKQDPVSYKVFVEDSGEKATIEFRLFVLSSQHEDSCFRMKIIVSIGEKEVSEIFSEPIRVVSKASQVNKEKKNKKPTSEIKLVSPSSPITPPATISSKRSVSESAILEVVLRLEEQQKEQRKIIDQLLMKQKKPENQENDFETAFIHFLEAYKALPTEERPKKIRRILEIPSSTDNLNQFIFYCSSLEDFNPLALTKVPLKFRQLLDEIPLNISTDGPSRKEIEAWDNVYSELTWSPDSD